MMCSDSRPNTSDAEGARGSLDMAGGPRRWCGPRVRWAAAPSTPTVVARNGAVSPCVGIRRRTHAEIFSGTKKFGRGVTRRHRVGSNLAADAMIGVDIGNFIYPIRGGQLINQFEKESS